MELSLFTPDLNVIKVIHVIKGTDADASLAEGLVNNAHVRLGHVIKEDLNLAALCVAHHLDLMPSAVFPGRLIRVLC